MAYPAGVQTVTLRLGSSFDSAGTLASITGHVVPLFGVGADHLVWGATGQTYAKVRTALAWDETEKVALATVPHPTQAGWKDQTQASFAGWSYQITTVAVYASGERHSFERTVTPQSGDTVINVDLLPNGAAATPTVVAEWEQARADALAALAASEVEQVTLTGNLAYTLPASVAPNRVHSVVFTQDGTGDHTVTYGGNPVAVDLAAGASTLVEIWPSGAVLYPGATGGGGGGAGFVVSDSPSKPASGQAATYLASPAVVWPAGIEWSSEPDGGTAPTITTAALVTLLTNGSTTYGICGATFGAALPPNTAPVVAITNVSKNGLESTVAFTATDADGDPVTVTVDWGDGLSGVVTSPASHTYAAAGTYTVTLTASDGVDTGTDAASITVPPPQLSATFLSVGALNTTSGDTRTWAAFNLGAASPTRHMVVFVGAYYNESAADIITGVTVQGVSATRLRSVVNGKRTFASLWLAPVPSGASGDIVVTTSALSSRVRIAAWSVDGAPVVIGATAGSSTNSAGVTATATLNSASPGGVVLVGSTGVTNAAAAWTGVVEDFDEATAANLSISGGRIEPSAAGAISVTHGTYAAIVAAEVRP